MSAETKSKWICLNCKSVGAGSKAAGLSSSTDSEKEGKSGSASQSPSLYQADLDAIGSVIKTMIQTELAPFTQEFSAIRESIDFISTEFDNFKKELSAFKSNVKTLTEENAILKSANSQLKSELYSLQEYTRRDNLIITGIPETGSESVYDIFNKVSSTINSQLTSEDISTAHRLPTKNKAKIKPFVVKFLRRQDKESWLTNFKNVSSKDRANHGISTKSIDNMYPDGKVFAHQHLPAHILDRLKVVRAVAFQKGYKYVWARQEKIYVRKDATQQAILIRSKEDLNTL
ncbi:uncharacterized protein LOC111050412 [Nilaparvata lugens]|uniref:uncharacterized protein LOC111050412 n=1 Tax=Nilaparvata lugens TaxID=108931 RepID=UPI00193D15D0|nr:uncharacterized protein LOC111050412 [Nilaparvata lugens]